ncbi:response regulator [Clostridium botulinum]|uniref:response regulator n=1 Tax=Clostridium botulinum TaxID=1491 RepID=UPI0013F11FC8|nr:response regulator [Clostridium botulinum]NFG24293.1 response regulator [Clostridium botulinum]NFO05184.1 response regulator [Clostridium botulinum]NFR14470.1 response regulator [Clostridium botulinum]NFR45094.1 response regulator [Clostridium botulinum]NFS52069.1 response regulator [Clostridium botulinum]
MDKVLIIDDNKQNCEIIKDLLYAWGYCVYLAFDGFDGFKLATRVNPDVILLDVMLPGMNGFETCKKLKETEETENIPIIMLTVLSEIEDKIRGFNVGADIFLSKPIVYQELKNRIAWAIKYKRVFDNMEQIDNVTLSLLNIIRLKDTKTYLHCKDVKNYCEKVGKILSLNDDEMKQLIIGAYLHDIGKIFSNTSLEHVEIGENIVSDLNMYKWLKVFIRNHHEKMNGKGFPDGLKSSEMSQNLKILITVNRFIELLDELKDSEASIFKLSDECEKGEFSTEIIKAIRQVLEDERFIERINYN